MTTPHNAIISVQNISKIYHLYNRPQDRLKHQLFQRFGKSYGNPFKALYNVSFNVNRGEVFGIIGRNGSGKSTLLQILAGIIQPTSGTVLTKGRVAALLELGSGFNPEYTGRENVFINGAVLGLPREAIQQRIDDIASFADIETFFDQPVKTYSSGMFVRLAFAVMTHVETDILLIDEALAVGDVFFRQKCYQKLDVLRQRGVTIIVVSHAMTDVEQLCQRALLLDRGTVTHEGTASEVVKHYYLLKQSGRVISQAVTPQPSPPTLTGPTLPWPVADTFLDITNLQQISNQWSHCTNIAICDSQLQACQIFQQGETISFFYEFEVLRDLEVPIGGIVIYNDKGIIVHGKNTLEYDSNVPRGVQQGSHVRFQQEIAAEIALGEYTVEIGFAAISYDDYQSRSLYTHTDLYSKIARLCHLPAACQFAVTFRHQNQTVSLLHHGIANLPGHCHVGVLPPAEYSAQTSRMS